MRWVLLSVLVCLTAGCAEDAPPKTGEEAAGSERPRPKVVPRLVVSGEGARFVQRQRSTAGLPGSQDRVLLTLDDITRGQVMLSMATSDQQSVVALRSVRAGDEVSFELDAQRYVLIVEAIDNQLAGDDTARFLLRGASVPPDDVSDGPDQNKSPQAITEGQKIERLIRAVAELKGATFIRNGKEHSGEQAAEHMRRKWEWKKDEIRTAEDFIRLAATESSASGEPYIIRLPDGREVKSAELLRQKLREIE